MTPSYRHAGSVALTLLAVVAIQAAFLSVLVAMAVPLLALPGLALASLLGRTVGANSIPVPVLVGLGGLGLVGFVALQFRYARSEALARVDAEVIGAEHPDLEARVQRLAMIADVEPPSVVVTPASTPNSFGIGGPRPTVVVSLGLLDRLDDDELDAALAHELAHVANRDAMVMTMAGFLPALASDRYSLLREVYPYGPWETLAAGTIATLLVSAFVLLELGIVGLLLPFVVAVVVFLDYAFGGIVIDGLAVLNCRVAGFLSRRREYAADRTAAGITGDPAALASALERLHGPDPPAVDSRAGGSTRTAGTGPGTTVGTEGRDPFDGGVVEPLTLVPTGPIADASPGLLDRGGDPWDGHRTHPPTGDRVERLRSMVVDLESD